MNHQTKVILRTVTTVMVCLTIVFAFLISAIRILGLDIYGVLTGSMEPTYPVGSLIYVKKVNPEELRVRDVITYSPTPNTVVTHRIVELVPDENNPYVTRFRTKGDANNDVDASLVNPASIIGKVVFSIPHLGNVANYIQNPPGIYVAIAVSIALIVIVFITDNVTSKDASGKEEKRIEMPWFTNLLAKVGITWPKPEDGQASPQVRQMDNPYPQQPPQYQPQYQQSQYQAQPQYAQPYQQPVPQYPSQYQQPQYPQQYQQPQPQYQQPYQAQPQYLPQYSQPQPQQSPYPQQNFGQAAYPQQAYPQQRYQQGYPDRPAPQQPRSYPTQANQLGKQPRRCRSAQN